MGEILMIALLGAAIIAVIAWMVWEWRRNDRYVDAIMARHDFDRRVLCMLLDYENWKKGQNK